MHLIDHMAPALNGLGYEPSMAPILTGPGQTLYAFQTHENVCIFYFISL